MLPTSDGSQNYLKFGCEIKHDAKLSKVRRCELRQLTFHIWISPEQSRKLSNSMRGKVFTFQFFGETFRLEEKCKSELLVELLVTESSASFKPSSCSHSHMKYLIILIGDVKGCLICNPSRASRADLSCESFLSILKLFRNSNAKFLLSDTSIKARKHFIFSGTLENTWNFASTVCTFLPT